MKVSKLLVVSFLMVMLALVMIVRCNQTVVIDPDLVGEWIDPGFTKDFDGIIFYSDGSGTLLTTTQGPREVGPWFRWRKRGSAIGINFYDEEGNLGLFDEESHDYKVSADKSTLTITEVRPFRPTEYKRVTSAKPIR